MNNNFQHNRGCTVKWNFDGRIYGYIKVLYSTINFSQYFDVEHILPNLNALMPGHNESSLMQIRLLSAALSPQSKKTQEL